MSLTLGVHTPVVPDKDAATVVSCKAFVLPTESSSGGADCHSQSAGHWIVDTPIANPSSKFPAYKASRTSWGIDALGTIVVEVTLTNGMQGQGISVGGAPACYIVEEHLARFVEGQDPRNVELIWDQMWRSTVNYGRKGLPIQAMSAVDLALWDILGKLRNEPVYQLLGGKVTGRLPVYATSTRPDLSKAMGFHGAKFPLPYGPADGDAGMRKNLERIKQVRASVGPDYPIMIDCYMSLTVPYTVELARRIDREVPNSVKWLEECLMPDNYKGYAELRQKIGPLGIMITCGEHEYTRYGMRQLLEQDCVDVLQPDITWCGGITEAKRICALAAAYDIPIVPHGSSVYSYHLQVSQPNTPVAEFLVMSPQADKIVSYFGSLFEDEPLPKDGYIELDPNKPGFGVTLNKTELQLVRPYPRDEMAGTAAAEAFTRKQQDNTPNQEEWLRQAASKIPSHGVSND